jgi:hypothetical protein
VVVGRPKANRNQQLQLDVVAGCGYTLPPMEMFVRRVLPRRTPKFYNEAVGTDSVSGSNWPFSILLMIFSLTMRKSSSTFSPVLAEVSVNSNPYRKASLSPSYRVTSRLNTLTIGWVPIGEVALVAN